MREDRRLRHYVYAWRPRAGAPPRPIAQPKHPLKTIQRWILREILDRIPAHDAAHGFIRGRSARTHAALHVARGTVMRMDLEDFFASVTAARVHGIFRAAGYSEAVARMLTGLCVTVVPRAEWAALPRPDDPALIARHHRLGRRLATPHLPQGAPTSPRSPRSPPAAWTGGSPYSRQRLRRATPATPTTSRSRATPRCPPTPCAAR